MDHEKRFLVRTVAPLREQRGSREERGIVVAIWEQRDPYGNRFYTYQVETETHVYDFLGNEAQVFHAGDIITFAINMHHRQMWVSTGGRKLKLFLLSRGTMSAS